MAITYGVTTNSATAGTGATTKTTASTTTQNGDTFLIFVMDDDPPTSVSDNKGNTYTLVGQSSNGLKRIYIAQGATTGGAGHTFSATYASNAWCAVFGMWVRGAGSYDTGSVNINSRGGAGPWWTGNVAFAQADNLLISFAAFYAGSPSSTFSWTTFGTGPAPSVIANLPDSANYNPGGLLASQGTFGLTGYSIDITVSSSSSGAEILTIALPDAGGGGGVSGTIAWTEADDTASIAGSLAVSGGSSWTEANDTASLAGNVKVSGTASWTEANDTASIAGALTVSGSASWTEASDTASLTGTVGNVVSGSLAWTEADDTAALAGSLLVSGLVAWTEANDSWALAGQVTQPATGAISWTEDNDLWNVTGTSGAGGIDTWGSVYVRKKKKKPDITVAGSVPATVRETLEKAFAPEEPTIDFDEDEDEALMLLL